MAGLAEEALVKIYKSKDASLSQLLNEYVPLWMDIRNFLAPRTARFPGEQSNNGRRQDLNILNTAPRDAVRTLASGLQSGVTSPMRPWFKLGTPDPDLAEYGPVKDWLYIVERILRDIMLRSNIYDRLKASYGMLGCYGTAALALLEDEKSVIRAYDFPTGTYKLATDDTLRVNTTYRDTNLTAAQMIGKFCNGNNDPQGALARAQALLPNAVVSAYDKGNYDQLFPMIQIIEPNRRYRPGSELSQFKKYASVWYDPTKGAEGIYQISGYDDFVVMAPRWDILGEDVYGYGCGELALGDSKQLQLMEKRKLQGIDKNVNPPMVADASMRNQRSTIMPGETTYVNGLITGKPGFAPAYQVNPYINELREEGAAVSNRVDIGFFKPLFLMVAEIGDQPNITATQINALREEKLMMLGPVLERLNDELLDPMIDRVFNLAFKAGMLPPPPPELEGMPLRIEYISVLAQAQKALGIGNIERFVGFVNNLAQGQIAAGGAPTALDKLDIDQTIDEYAGGVNAPPTIINTDEEVAQIRDARAQQQQQQQAMAMAQQGAETAKTLSETETQDGNALTTVGRAMKIAGMTGANRNAIK